MRRKAGEAAAKQTGMQILWGAAESRRAVLPCMRRESRSCTGGAAGSAACPAYSAAGGRAGIPAAESHKERPANRKHRQEAARGAPDRRRGGRSRADRRIDADTQPAACRCVRPCAGAGRRARGKREASDTIVPEDIESSDADLLADGPVSLQGEVKISTENTLFLSWEEPISILLKQGDGEYVRVNDISSVYLENRDVDPALWDELPLPQAVEISGELSIDGTRLYLAADSLTDTDGNALVVEAAPADEILPDSDDRLLTKRDISGLSLQQINYAKNEIYARHGRCFLSPELQNYFNAQPWYRGTVDADQFDESILSDIEKKNAEFLAEVEFSIEPNGYKLDA